MFLLVFLTLHLLLDQVLGLNERANELVSLLTFQDPNLVLMHHVGLLKLLFLSLKLVLLVDEIVVFVDVRMVELLVVVIVVLLVEKVLRRTKSRFK